MAGSVVHGVSLLTDYDLYLFRVGNHTRLYEVLGAHPMAVEGVPGTLFSVWAPNAEWVSVVGDFNGWDDGAHRLASRWEQNRSFRTGNPGIRG